LSRELYIRASTSVSLNTRENRALMWNSVDKKKALCGKPLCSSPYVEFCGPNRAGRFGKGGKEPSAVVLSLFVSGHMGICIHIWVYVYTYGFMCTHIYV